MSYFFFLVDFSYRFEHCFKKEIVGGFKSQIEFITIVDVIHLYYTVVSGVVRFEVKVVFLQGCFSPFFLTVLRLTLIIVNSLCFLSDARCVHILTLKFSDSSIFKSSFGSMFDMFKDIDMKVFPKLKNNGIRSTIAILRSMTLAFFWGIGFQDSFFSCRQSLVKCSFLLQLQYFFF